LTNVLDDFIENVPHILVNLQTLQLCITTAHRTLPCASVTVHLKIGLHVKTLYTMKEKEN
jgi:hypothetical protein